MIPNPDQAWLSKVARRESQLVGLRARELARLSVLEYRQLEPNQLEALIQDYHERAKERLREFVSDAEIRIRIKAGELSMFLADGVYKTLFVTGRSGGSDTIALRESVEQTVLNVPANTSPHDRPVHAYLEGSDETGDVAQWGPIILGLRPYVRDRATFVLGDTIDGTG